MVSFRLGGSDGVAIEAAKWADALGLLGFTVRSVAGAGPVDHVLPGLAMEAPEPPTRAEVDAALAGADLVIVENLCSLPLNPAAAAVVAAACAGRPTVLHHHDLPWQRPQFAHHPPPPDDPAWAHVTINELSRTELAAHGIGATTIYNSFDPDPSPGDRAAVRARLGVGEGTPLLLQPTRALPRKNIGAAIALAEATGATYWLLGPAEDGYGPELERLVAEARCASCSARRGAAAPWPTPMRPAMPCCSPRSGRVSAIHRWSRRRTGGRWPSARTRWRRSWRPSASSGSTRRTRPRWRRWLEHPDMRLIAHNQRVAADHFNLADLPGPPVAGARARSASLTVR